jgi:hypothetical protein
MKTKFVVSEWKFIFSYLMKDIQIWRILTLIISKFLDLNEIRWFILSLTSKLDEWKISKKSINVSLKKCLIISFICLIF